MIDKLNKINYHINYWLALEEFEAMTGNLTQTFKALSDETRLKILLLLKDGEACVCDIAETLGMTQPNISFHLGILKEAGLLKDRKNGRWMHYSLNESDMFTRFLLFGIFEQMKDDQKKRLKKSEKC